MSRYPNFEALPERFSVTVYHDPETEHGSYELEYDGCLLAVVTPDGANGTDLSIYSVPNSIAFKDHRKKVWKMDWDEFLKAIQCIKTEVAERVDGA